MSFEGYYQKLCSKGHLTICDVYNEVHKCSCKRKFVWKHMVDETNGDGNPVKLKVNVKKLCKHCNTVLETIYKIP